MLRLTRLHISGALLSLLLGTAAASAQNPTEPSLGEVARAERERRAAQPPLAPRRMLTNEDLQRERILEKAATEEEAPAAGKSAASQAPPPALPVEVSAVPVGPEVSLGEYARDLRRRQQARRSPTPVVQSADLEPEGIPREGVAESGSLVAPASGHARALPSAAVPYPNPSYSSYAPGYGGRPGEPSLGEVARRLRRERAERRAALAAQRPEPPLPPAEPLPQPRVLTRRSVAPAPPAAREAEATSGPRTTIRVRRGDSLWKLASTHLGDAAQWPLLWRANPHIPDPDVIHPGQVLRLPERAAVEIARQPAPAASRPAAQEADAGRDLQWARERIAQISPWEPLWLTAPAPATQKESPPAARPASGRTSAAPAGRS